MTDQKTQAREYAHYSPEHERLAPFAGTFRAQVKLWMGPGEPNITGGVMVSDWVLGGRFLRQIFTGDAPDDPIGAFEGMGFWGFDTTSGKFRGFWIDNASTAMQYESGIVDESGKVWTMSSRLLDPRTGKPMHKRSLITLIDDDHHRMESFFSDDSGKEFKSMEINYERMK